MGPIHVARVRRMYDDCMSPHVCVGAHINEACKWGPRSVS